VDRLDLQDFRILLLRAADSTTDSLFPRFAY